MLKPGEKVAIKRKLITALQDAILLENKTDHDIEFTNTEDIDATKPAIQITLTKVKKHEAGLKQCEHYDECSKYAEMTLDGSAVNCANCPENPNK